MQSENWLKTKFSSAADFYKFLRRLPLIPEIDNNPLIIKIKENGWLIESSWCGDCGKKNVKTAMTEAFEELNNNLTKELKQAILNYASNTPTTFEGL